MRKVSFFSPRVVQHEDGTASSVRTISSIGFKPTTAVVTTPSSSPQVLQGKDIQDKVWNETRKRWVFEEPKNVAGSTPPPNLRGWRNGNKD